MKVQAAIALVAASVPLVIGAQHNSPSDRALAKDALTQLGKGTIMYTMDCDDRLPANVRQVVNLAPYLKSVSIFRPFPSDRPAVTYSGSTPDPRHPRETIQSDFAFNPALFGKETTKLEAPAKTVLWSYGTRSHLRFDIGGKTIEAMGDGSIHFTSKAQAKSLRWRP